MLGFGPSHRKSSVTRGARLMPVAELLNGGIRLGGGYALMALRLNLIFGV